MIRSGVFMRSLSALLAAGATALGNPAMAQAKRPYQTEQRTPAPPVDVDILPLLDMDRGPPTPLPDGSPRAVNYIGGYTRFQVDTLPFGSSSDSAVTRSYRSEDRNIARWFAGASLSRVLSLRVGLSQPNVSTTTTLAAASHDSNRRTGEVWTSELHGRRLLTPYFRVDATTTATIEANLNASRSVSGDVTANLINVLGRAANLLTPASTLVTTLTEKRLTDASEFVDQSISAFFSESLSEKTAAEYGPGDWGRVGITITAYLPHRQGLSDSDERDRIGAWEVSLADPLVSIFSTVPLCPSRQTCDGDQRLAQARTAFGGLAAYTVLNFRLDGQQALIQSIRSDDAVARGLETLTVATTKASTSKDAAVVAAARSLCNGVASKAESLGFNLYDTIAAVWAVAHSGLVDARGGTALLAQDTCGSSALMRSLGLATDDLAGSAASVAPPAPPAPTQSTSSVAQAPPEAEPKTGPPPPP